ncbi:MAG: hypothetical protein VX278_14120 [Myxococcota bacterium]|nr:hypothetical protein [Myxococcota bacterium]
MPSPNQAQKRLFDSLHLNMETGGLGGVFAKAGVGKTALLIHLAFFHIQRQKKVLHISLRDPQARVRNFYDELYAERSRLSEESEFISKQEVATHRLVYSSPGQNIDIEDVEQLLTSFGELIDFTPKILIIDGFQGELSPDSWKELAKRKSLAIWISISLQENVEESDLAAFDSAIELVPIGQKIEIHNLLPHQSSFSPIYLDPMTRRLLPQRQSPLNSPNSASILKPDQCTLYSGGAAGSETLFGEQAEKWGLKEVNFSFSGHVQRRMMGQKQLSLDDLAEGAVSLQYVSRKLNRSWEKTPLLKKVLQLLWHVVSNADQVFIIGTIQEDGTVHGGTGWSVELAKRWKKPLWVFDQDRESWFLWDGSDWVPNLPRIESNKIAGSGTRFLSDASKKAIEALFYRSFNY